MRWRFARRAPATMRRRDSPYGVIVRLQAWDESGRRAQRLGGRLAPLVVRSVRPHANTPNFPNLCLLCALIRAPSALIATT
jgi:hypothetical protein